jgi:hypothetical protein
MSDVFTGNSVDRKSSILFIIVVEFSLLYENKNKQIGAKKKSSTASPETILYTLHTHTHISRARVLLPVLCKIVT